MMGQGIGLYIEKKKGVIMSEITKIPKEQIENLKKIVRKPDSEDIFIYNIRRAIPRKIYANICESIVLPNLSDDDKIDLIGAAYNCGITRLKSLFFNFRACAKSKKLHNGYATWLKTNKSQF
jgi:hypothetical protein